MSAECAALACVEMVWDVPDLLALILRHVSDVEEARAVCRRWRDCVDGGKARPLPPAHIDALARGEWAQTITRGKLLHLLALPNSGLSSYRFNSIRRYGGGEYHVFYPSEVQRIFIEHGGIDALATRIVARRKRQRRWRESQRPECRAARLIKEADRKRRREDLDQRRESARARRALWLSEQMDAQFGDTLPRPSASLWNTSAPVRRLLEHKGVTELKSAEWNAAACAVGAAAHTARTLLLLEPNPWRGIVTLEREDAMRQLRAHCFEEMVAQAFLWHTRPNRALWRTSPAIAKFLDEDDVDGYVAGRAGAAQLVWLAAQLRDEMERCLDTAGVALTKRRMFEYPSVWRAVLSFAKPSWEEVRTEALAALSVWPARARELLDQCKSRRLWVDIVQANEACNTFIVSGDVAPVVRRLNAFEATTPVCNVCGCRFHDTHAMCQHFRIMHKEEWRLA